MFRTFKDAIKAKFNSIDKNICEKGVVNIDLTLHINYE